MPFRLIQVRLSESLNEERLEELRGMGAIDAWQVPLKDEGVLLGVTADALVAETLADSIKERHGWETGFRLNLVSVEATIPAPEEAKKADADKDQPTDPGKAEAKKPASIFRARIHRDELRADIASASKVGGVFIPLAFISAIVAANGLLRDNVAVIIGAMVIAPLLGPNVGLALAATLADASLAKESLKANFAGVVAVFVPSVLLGLVIDVEPLGPEILARTQVDVSDIILALASGVAGVLAFTSGASGTLVGVMVAVALVPPLVVFGMLLGAGLNAEAVGALTLLATNLICVNFAGVTTFAAQGVRPSSWWESRKAAKSTKLAIVLWFVLLAVLAFTLYYAGIF